MSHSHTCCLVHVVSATAERLPMIREDIQEMLYRYVGGIARENGIPALAVGVDHEDCGLHGLVRPIIRKPRTDVLGYSQPSLTGLFLALMSTQD
jgi:hypothetical protein